MSSRCLGPVPGTSDPSRNSGIGTTSSRSWVAASRLPIALAAAAAFGWAAITLSGHRLVTGIRLVPDQPALGLVLPFVSITVGQAPGIPRCRLGDRA